MAETRIIRSIEEITASAKMNMADMVHRAIALGHDLADAKELLGHGAFLPWLKEIGISSSTAANYMKVSREIAPGSRLASMPYSKVLALLSVPAEEREALAEETEGKTAAEIRKLIAERDKAAESCNAETTRADMAEADAKRFYDENSRLNNKIKVLENKLESQNSAALHMMKERDDTAEELKKTRADLMKEVTKRDQDIRDYLDEIDKLRSDLIVAENSQATVEVVPEDYEQLKKMVKAGQIAQDELVEAAAAAEERAAAAEEELERMKNQQVNGGTSDYEKLHYNMKIFMLNCELMAVDVRQLLPDRDKAIKDVDRIAHWCSVIRDQLALAVIDPDGSVVV